MSISFRLIPLAKEIRVPPKTKYLDRVEGRIAYDVSGDYEPLVLCVPGMGDLRSSFSTVRAELTAKGIAVATMDLRGHGDSDAGFADFGAAAAGDDALALLEALGRPALIVGNSMGAGAAVWVAAEKPELVSGLLLLGPFIRDVPMSRAKRLAIRVALRRPWGPALWTATYRKLNAGDQPEGLEAHIAAIRQNMSRSDRWRAFVATTRTSHAAISRRTDEVRRTGVPTRILMGRLDPDFEDPATEASLVAERVGGEVEMLELVGHYPQIQRPGAVVSAVRAMLANDDDAASA